MLEGLTKWLLGRKLDESDIELRISKRRLDAFEQTIDGQLTTMSARIKKLEGEYGRYVRDLKEENADLAVENEQLSKQIATAQDIQEQQRKLNELAPKALEQMGIGEEHQRQILAWLSSPTNRAQVEALIQEYFPDTPVSIEGLIGLAPVLKAFLGKGTQKENESNPKY